MKIELTRQLPIAEGLCKLLHPFAEVVIHDLESDTIVAIYNSISKREVGDPSFLESQADQNTCANTHILGPYEKTNYDGRKLKSISMVIQNLKGTTIGFLCINLDITIFDQYKVLLDTFLTVSTEDSINNFDQIFKEDLHEQLNTYVQQYCLQHALNVNTMTRDEKKDLVLILEDHKALDGKNATSYIARILDVSRATIYNYLKAEG